ncbi:MAG TPA: hypothetical protein ENN67_07210 [Firmicutes bacterium]|nr:hypothetical protein [Bacillota bacterium]
MRIGLFLISLIAVLSGAPNPSTASVDESRLDEFGILMETLIGRVEQIESGYNPVLIGNIARTRRLEVFGANIIELEGFVEQAQNKTDPNSQKLVSLIDAIQSSEPTSDEIKPLLLESWVRSILMQCESRGIGADEVGEYARRQMASFVADRGNFFHPDFDNSTLGSKDIVRIYFTGFGLVILVHMESGIGKAIELYNQSTELRPYFAQQLVFRGADLDIAGIELLRTVFFDPAISPPAREVFYGVVAGKLIGPAGQFGNKLDLSNEWKTVVSGWAMEHITQPDRLDARSQLPFYGVEFNQAELGPESFLGLVGPPGAPYILSLLSSNDEMEQICGLEALRWFDLDEYPSEASWLFELSHSLMGSSDLTLAVLAMNALETDARYMGEPYDEPRRNRIRENIPVLTGLMDRAYRNENIDYISTSAWLDIFGEGSLRDELGGLMPMVAKVIVSDWERKLDGETVFMPEGEVKVITYFIRNDPSLFESTSDSLLGFFTSELDGGTMNPFRIWTYVEYLESASEAGIDVGDGWRSALRRAKSWAENAPALIRGDELKSAIDRFLEI